MRTRTDGGEDTRREVSEQGGEATGWEETGKRGDGNVGRLKADNINKDEGMMKDKEKTKKKEEQ